MPPHASGIPRSTSGIENQRVVGGDAQVAGGREYDSAADAMAVDGADRQRSHVGQRLGGDAPEIGGRSRRHLHRLPDEVVEVESRRERPSLAADDHDSDLTLLVDPPARRRDLGEEHSRQRVQAFRAIEHE